MLVSGNILKKTPSGIYLITFRSSDSELEGKIIEPNLVDLLREYIM